MTEVPTLSRWVRDATAVATISGEGEEAVLILVVLPEETRVEARLLGGLRLLDDLVHPEVHPLGPVGGLPGHCRCRIP